MNAASSPIVYLDYASTTPVAAEVVAAMRDCLSPAGAFANPASAHAAGRRSAGRVEEARARVASLIHARPRELIFTSGATESVNLAVQGAARYRATRGRHLVTLRSEHKAAVACFEALEREGFEVSWLPCGADGVLDLALLEGALRDDTQLVSVMHVNNEIGVIQDIAAIGALCRSRDILFHCDAAQSAGKLPLDVEEMAIDLLSLTAHKMYGPQGAGALYVADRPGCHVEPLLYGGAQERRLRPGTLAVHQIVGFGAAAELATAGREQDLAHVRSLYDRLWAGIGDLPGVIRNGAAGSGYCGILNVSAPGVDGESLMLDLEPLCVAAGSACNAQSGEPSQVLHALGAGPARAQSAIRFSFGRGTSAAEIDLAIERYRHAVTRLTAMAPPGGSDESPESGPRGAGPRRRA
ncbi:MAG: cysteine desulfurase family protein [Woeseiaceae bacterium]